MTVRMKQRRGLAALWTSTNPTLLEGQIGFETDTGRFKIGDGLTAWTSLAYAADTPGGLDAHIADTAAAHAASAVSFSPTGTVAATSVQSAIAEVATDAASALTTHESDTTSVHGITDTSTLYRSGGTDVAVADGGTGGSDAATARTNLGVDYATLDERTRDTIGTALVAGANITITPNDGADTITIAAAGGAATDPIYDAKGDLAVGTGANTSAKLTVGTNGTVPASDSAATTGIAWASMIPSLRPTSTYVTMSAKPAVSLAPVLNRVIYVPMVLAAGFAYTNFGTRVVAASGSGVLRIGLYTYNAGIPGSLIADGGTVTSASPGAKYVAINYTATAPVVFVAICPQTDTTSLTLVSPNNNSAWSPAALFQASNSDAVGCYYESSVSGALPSTATPVGPDAHNGANAVAFGY